MYNLAIAIHAMEPYRTVQNVVTLQHVTNVSVILTLVLTQLVIYVLLYFLIAFDALSLNALNAIMVRCSHLKHFHVSFVLNYFHFVLIALISHVLNVLIRYTTFYKMEPASLAMFSFQTALNVHPLLAYYVLKHLS